MTFCSRCGAQASDLASFCPSCGAALARPVAPAPWAEPAPLVGPRTTGRVMEPWLVPLLVFITLSIYSFVYFWRVSREVDDFAGRPRHAHGMVRTGVFVAGGALAAIVVGFILVLVAVASDDAVRSDAPPSEDVRGSTLAAAGTGMLILIAGGLAGVVGTVFLLIGEWRVWETIRDDERRRRVPKPLSPGLMLAFTLIPYLNLVTMWIAFHRTQKGLNAMWAAQQGSA